MRRFVAIYRTGQLCPIHREYIDAPDAEVAEREAKKPGDHEGHWRNHYRLESVAEVVYEEDANGPR